MLCIIKRNLLHKKPEPQKLACSLAQSKLVKRSKKMINSIKTLSRRYHSKNGFCAFNKISVFRRFLPRTLKISLLSQALYLATKTTMEVKSL